MNPHKELAIRVLRDSIGDDLYRANCAFGHMPEKELDQQHGKSGKTRRQIIQEYKDHEEKRVNALKWLEGVPE